SPVDGPPNNWVSAFGGPAWSRDEQSGRWYLHSFYPEQPDLDWRNPEVVEAFQGVVRFWVDRGVDGFRLDAIAKLIKDDQLRDDPPATDTFPLPLRDDAAKLRRVYSGDRPEAIEALGALRAAAGHPRAPARLRLTRRGAAFIYQGDEIGLPNGPGAAPTYDRAGRDPMRHPMQWDATPTGGFTPGEPWLPPVDPAERNVEAQLADP